MTDEGQPGAGVFHQLDYVYTPSVDVAADTAWFADVLGAQVVFTIEASGTRVAMLRLTSTPPNLLLTDHLEGERPILVYRVTDLADTVARLEAGGWKPERTIEIPVGPCRPMRSAGGQRMAIYERTRPEVEEHFHGRRDF